MSLKIRPMRLSDLALALEWAAVEGWNPGLHDAEAFFAADPQGFFIGESEGRPVGCISLVKYGADFSFLGLYIVRPEDRGRGYGLSLWNAAVDSAGNRCIGLDGVVAQQENYKKSGFRWAGRNIRFEKPALRPMPSDSPQLDSELRVEKFSLDHWDQLVAFDRRYFPAPRETFLKTWLNQPGSSARVVMRNGALQGYGVIRRCRQGFKIGPLFADRPDAAEHALRALCEAANGASVFLDVPETNSAARALADKYGMTKVFETARMYRGEAPLLPWEGIYGVTTFELG